ncbi:MAG: hypothetical protein SVT56_06485 [Chloroflexota bacterium]|nr:hypothetical protein [Chloroflexota bacterium]
MIFEGHGKFRGDVRADQDGLASAHGQGEDVGGVVEGEGFVDGFEFVGFNSLIQAAKARARGYRTNRNLITMAYLIAGNLNYGLPT